MARGVLVLQIIKILLVSERWGRVLIGCWEEVVEEDTIEDRTEKW